MKTFLLFFILLLTLLVKAEAAPFPCQGQIANRQFDAAYPNQFAYSFGWALENVEKDSFYKNLKQDFGEPLSCVGEILPPKNNTTQYLLRYSFQKGAKLDDLVPASGGDTRETLLMQGLDLPEAMHILETMMIEDAGKISTLKPQTLPANTHINPLLKPVWTEQVFTWEDTCDQRASIVYDGTTIVGLTAQENCD